MKGSTRCNLKTETGKRNETARSLKTSPGALLLGRGKYISTPITLARIASCGPTWCDDAFVAAGGLPPETELLLRAPGRGLGYTAEETPAASGGR